MVFLYSYVDGSICQVIKLGKAADSKAERDAGSTGVCRRCSGREERDPGRVRGSGSEQSATGTGSERTEEGLGVQVGLCSAMPL